MSETIKASFEVGHNRNISGIIEANSESFSCWSHDRFYIDEHSNIYGVTDKAQNVSLLNCLGQTSHIVGKNNQSHSSNVYAHTIVLGNDKVCPDNDKFCSILIHVANPAKLFQDSRALGYIDPLSDDLISQLNKNKLTEGFSKEGLPFLAYYNGDIYNFKQETEIGTISAVNLISTPNQLDSFHVAIHNNIAINIDFHSPLTIDEALQKANSVSFFLRCIGGKGLYFKDIKLTKAADDHSNFEVHRDSFNWGVCSNKNSSTDALLDVSQENFSKIIKNWFDTDEKFKSRMSFFSTYFSEVYNSERLICASTMFEILPWEPPQETLVEDKDKELLSELITHINSNFSGTPDIKRKLCNKAKELRRNKKNKLSLIEKIFKRLDLISTKLPERNLSHKDLKNIVRIAVDARVYFVHGTTRNRIATNLIFKYQPLLINTLEYIYLFSELLECGWNEERGNNRFPHHPFYVKEKEISFYFSELKKEDGVTFEY